MKWQWYCLKKGELLERQPPVKRERGIRYKLGTPHTFGVITKQKNRFFCLCAFDSKIHVDLHRLFFQLWWSTSLFHLRSLFMQWQQPFKRIKCDNEEKKRGKNNETQEKNGKIYLYFQESSLLFPFIKVAYSWYSAPIHTHRHMKKRLFIVIFVSIFKGNLLFITITSTALPQIHENRTNELTTNVAQFNYEILIRAHTLHTVFTLSASIARNYEIRFCNIPIIVNLSHIDLNRTGKGSSGHSIRIVQSEWRKTSKDSRMNEILIRFL